MNKVILIARTSCNILKNLLSRGRLFYIVENADWSIKHDGLSVTKRLRFTSSITTTRYGIRNSVVHYGSINTFIHGKKGLRLPHKSNRIVVTWFHIAPNDSRIKYVSEAIKHVDVWHTACITTKDKLISLGIPMDKIILIPLGVDLNIFLLPTIKEQTELREKFSIPKGKVVIGSYQKDGNGWGEGLKPKLIKGPDIFCDAVERLAKHRDVFVLLTGPARGYVKRRLEEADIPYRHDFLESPDEVSNYYKVTDLYIVTSREEGGPKQILESMASGVPVISTRVGMAPDIIVDGENGFVVDVEGTKALVQRATQVLENKHLRESIINKGLDTVTKYDWGNIASKYHKKIYQRLM